MSKFLDETGLTHLVSKLDEKFGGLYVPRKEFDSFSTDINSQISGINSQISGINPDINVAMYGPYSVGYESVQFTYGTGQSTTEVKSLTLTDAMGGNSPRIYVIDLSLSQRAPASKVRRLNLYVGSSIETDISSLTAGYQDRFNNLSGGIQRVVIRFTGAHNFLTDRVFISLSNGSFYKPYTLSVTEPGTVQSQAGYQMLGLKGINNNLSYVIIDFVGHGRPRLSIMNTTVFAVPQLVGCMGWLTSSLT